MDSQNITHAGGVVFRITRSGQREFLLVTAKRNPGDWVHPKGHIELGETPEACAIREVQEEAGVNAEPLQALLDVERALPGDRQRVRYFVMRTREDGNPGEGRQARWLSYERARDLLSVPALRTVLEEAETFLRKR